MIYIMAQAQLSPFVACIKQTLSQSFHFNKFYNLFDSHFFIAFPVLVTFIIDLFIMKQTGEKLMQQKLQLSHSKLEDNKPKDTIVNREPQNSSLFRHFEKNLVLFAYTREADEDPPTEIMVLQQSKKHYKTQEQKFTQMFGNLNLQGKTQKLFLTKIDPLEHKEIAKQIEQMMQVSNNYSRQDRQERRKQIFEASRTHKIRQELASEEVMAKRKIRLVKMDSLIQGGTIKGVVELGGKSVQYQDLSLMAQNRNYYALTRKKVSVDEVFPQVNIQQKYLHTIDFQVEQQEQKYQNDDDYDSNDSQNSAFDYPDEESSRSSEEIIRDYDQMDQYYEHSEDQEELYRRYLRRERRKEQHMDEEVQIRYEEYD